MKYKRVFWILIGGENTGSSRIHGHNVHKAFMKKGIDSNILHQGSRDLTIKQKIKLILKLKKKDLLILQKRKDLSFKNLLFFLKLKGVKVAFVDCDLPICHGNLVNYFDYIICASRNLSELYREKFPNKKVKYIPDAVEYFNNEVSNYNQEAIYFGWLTEERTKMLKSFKALFKSCGWKLKTMSNRNNPDILWTDWKNDETYKIIGQHCASLIPVDSSNSAQYKSANRVLQSLAIGNVVFCGDLESYKEVIENGKNGFICSNDQDYIDALQVISDESKRNEIIANGYLTAKDFTMDKIILEWISFLKS